MPQQTGSVSNDFGVLDVLAARRSGVRDNHIVALALEGGGMRGVVSGAMLLALRDLGVMPLFDRLYGTSSGSINLAYFAAGGGWDALSVYYDYLIDGFVRRPPLPGRPLLDMGYVDRVMRHEVPLNGIALANSSYDVRILVTDVEKRMPFVVAAREVADKIHEYLAAGAWLPILAGRPYKFDGRHYLDGGLLWPDPLYGALAEGCTHVLMLNTSTIGSRGRTSRIAVRMLRTTLDRWCPGLGAAYLEGRARWDVDRPRLIPGRNIMLCGSSVMRLQPAAGTHEVQRLTVDKGALLEGARAGYSTIRAAFGRPMLGNYFSLVEGA